MNCTSLKMLHLCSLAGRFTLYHCPHGYGRTTYHATTANVSDSGYQNLFVIVLAELSWIEGLRNV
jgi:hypothetical protein